MARKTATIRIDAKGRDNGKVFIITEMSALAAEEWAGRALFAMMNAGVEIPDSIANAGLAGVASLGISSLTKVSFDSAKPLLDEMLGCVQIQPSPKVTRPLIDDDIEEVATLLTLRKEVLSLHIDFFTDGAGSTSALESASKTRA
jgi:hypothetical protein